MQTTPLLSPGSNPVRLHKASPRAAAFFFLRPALALVSKLPSSLATASDLLFAYSSTCSTKGGALGGLKNEFGKARITGVGARLEVGDPVGQQAVRWVSGLRGEVNTSA